jgi:hypothetical protein
VLVQDQNLFRDYRPWTDVSECWSRRWVIQWALSDNLQETEIIFYCSKSENIHNKMLLEWWRKALCKRHWVLFSESLCTELIQYTHDSTMTEHSERDVTDALLSQQFFWPEMLQNVCTFCQNCNKCCMNNSWRDCDKASWSLYLYWRNLTKDIHWLCSRFTVKWGLYKPSDNYNCLSKRIILESCKNMTAEWVTQTFVQHFYWAHELLLQ